MDCVYSKGLWAWNSWLHAKALITATPTCSPSILYLLFSSTTGSHGQQASQNWERRLPSHLSSHSRLSVLGLFSLPISVFSSSLYFTVGPAHSDPFGLILLKGILDHVNSHRHRQTDRHARTHAHTPHTSPPTVSFLTDRKGSRDFLQSIWRQVNEQLIRNVIVQPFLASANYVPGGNSTMKAILIFLSEFARSQEAA